MLEEHVKRTNEMTAVAASIDVKEISRIWRWLLSAGIMTMLAGALAILLPMVAALTVELFLGTLLVLAGGLKGAHAYRMRKYNGFTWILLDAVASLAAGILLLTFPLAGVLTLAIVMAVLFLLAGFFKCMFALNSRTSPGFNWLLLSGILSITLGVLMFSLWPEAAPTMIGVLLGIDLIFGGWWFTMLALVGRKYQPYTGEAG